MKSSKMEKNNEPQVVLQKSFNDIVSSVTINVVFFTFTRKEKLDY